MNLEFDLPLTLILLFMLLLVLMTVPFVPALLEWRTRRDARPGGVDPNYSRDPRFFGHAFRHRMGTLQAQLAANPEHALRDKTRGDIELHQRVDAAPGATIKATWIATQGATIGEKAVMTGDAWAQADATVACRAVLRSFACDGHLVLGEETNVKGWLDAEKSIVIGPRSVVSTSASTDGPLKIAHGAIFYRLWGLPVISTDDRGSVPADGAPNVEKWPWPEGFTVEERVVYARHRFAVPVDGHIAHDIVAYTDVHIGVRAHIGGTVKSHGNIFVDSDAVVEGNLIARGDIHIKPRAHVHGHIFTERDLFIGREARVAGEPLPQPEAGGNRSEAESNFTFKGVESARHMRLEPGVIVYGWVIAGAGGKIVE